MKIRTLTQACLFAMACGAHALEGSGKVLNTDGTPALGVVVRFSHGLDSAVTSVSGEWSLVKGALGVAPRTSRVAASSNLAIQDGKIQIRLEGHSALGRRSEPVPEIGASARSRNWAGRGAGQLDSLIYSYNGRVFLRDTLSASRSGMVRLYDTTWNANIVYGHLTDDRDGQIYRTVRMGSQVWMAQNLNFKGVGVEHENHPESGRKYGRLYHWSSVMAGAASSVSVPSGVKGICPTGWHVPSEREWLKLTDTLMTGDSSGILLQSLHSWETSGNGLDRFGFRILAAGGNGGNDFTPLGQKGAFWTATEVADEAWYRVLKDGNDVVERWTCGKGRGKSR
jgi:uncharacterized protein (TIGR02145 family)